MQCLGAQALEGKRLDHAVMALLNQLALAVRGQAGPAFFLLPSLLGRRCKGVEIIGNQQRAVLRPGRLRHRHGRLLGGDCTLGRRRRRGLDVIQAQRRQAFPGIGDAGGGWRQNVCQWRSFCRPRCLRLQRAVNCEGLLDRWLRDCRDRRGNRWR